MRSAAPATQTNASNDLEQLKRMMPRNQWTSKDVVPPMESCALTHNGYRCTRSNCVDRNGTPRKHDTHRPDLKEPGKHEPSPPRGGPAVRNAAPESGKASKPDKGDLAERFAKIEDITDKIMRKLVDASGKPKDDEPASKMQSLLKGKSNKEKQDMVLRMLEMVEEESDDEDADAKELAKCMGLNVPGMRMLQPVHQHEVKPELKNDEDSGLTFTYAYEECKEDEGAGEVNHQHGQCSLELKEKELKQYVKQFNLEAMKLRDQDDKELQQQVQQHVLTMTRQRFEKQPYFQVTLGGMKVHASMDTCCGAIGALCCEHFDKLKQNPDMFAAVVESYTLHDSPIGVKGVSGTEKQVQIVGRALLKGTVTDVRGATHLMPFEVDLLKNGSTGDAYLMVGHPLLRKWETVSSFSQTGKRDELLVISKPFTKWLRDPIIVPIVWQPDQSFAVRSISELQQESKQTKSKKPNTRALAPTCTCHVHGSPRTRRSPPSASIPSRIRPSATPARKGRLAVVQPALIGRSNQPSSGGRTSSTRLSVITSPPAALSAPEPAGAP